jgi:translocation and assembly module TamB
VLSVGGAPGASPTVEAGRNLGSGIYVGAKQATSGAGSQATVRLDLAPGLKLEADVGVAPAASTVPGAPPTGNQVGVTYELEY